MKFTVTASEGLPVGSYAARFASAEAVSNEFGDAVKLVFEVLQGEHTGATASRFCSTKLTPKSNLFKFLTALKGGKLEPGESVDLLTFIGSTGMMIVEATDSGATRVGSFMKIG